MTIPLEFLIDACPYCDPRNPTLPVSATTSGPETRCVYRCTAGHEWFTCWRDPWATPRTEAS